MEELRSLKMQVCSLHLCHHTKWKSLFCGYCCHSCSNITFVNSELMWHHDMHWFILWPIKSHRCSFWFISPRDMAGHDNVWMAFVMKRKLKQWWSTIPPILTKQTTTSQLKPSNTKKDHYRHKNVAGSMESQPLHEFSYNNCSIGLNPPWSLAYDVSTSRRLSKWC